MLGRPDLVVALADSAVGRRTAREDVAMLSRASPAVSERVCRDSRDGRRAVARGETTHAGALLEHCDSGGGRPAQRRSQCRISSNRASERIIGSELRGVFLPSRCSRTGLVQATRSLAPLGHKERLPSSPRGGALPIGLGGLLGSSIAGRAPERRTKQGCSSGETPSGSASRSEC
jgi:hypothetical protein